MSAPDGKLFKLVFSGFGVFDDVIILRGRGLFGGNWGLFLKSAPKNWYQYRFLSKSDHFDFKGFMKVLRVLTKF